MKSTKSSLLFVSIFALSFAACAKKGVEQLPAPEAPQAVATSEPSIAPPADISPETAPTPEKDVGIPVSPQAIEGKSFSRLVEKKDERERKYFVLESLRFSEGNQATKILTKRDRSEIEETKTCTYAVQEPAVVLTCQTQGSSPVEETYRIDGRFSSLSTSIAAPARAVRGRARTHARAQEITYLADSIEIYEGKTFRSSQRGTDLKSIEFLPAQEGDKVRFVRILISRNVNGRKQLTMAIANAEVEANLIKLSWSAGYAANSNGTPLNNREDAEPIAEGDFRFTFVRDLNRPLSLKVGSETLREVIARPARAQSGRAQTRSRGRTAPRAQRSASPTAAASSPSSN